jgi:DNA-binding transcriptional MerR regulator
MSTTPRYSISQLADLAGVTPRTVRYYIVQGLLPAVSQPGPGAKYGDAHLARLRVIRRLQREHLPLAEIRRRLEHLDDDAVLQLAEGEPTEDEPSTSALDYVRSLLSPSPPAREVRRLLKAAPPRFETSVVAEAAAPYAPREPAARPAAAPEPPAPAPTIDRSQWERIALSPDVELHIRRPLDRRLARRVDRVIAIARDLLEEDQP